MKSDKGDVHGKRVRIVLEKIQRLIYLLECTMCGTNGEKIGGTWKKL